MYDKFKSGRQNDHFIVRIAVQYYMYIAVLAGT